MKSILIVLSFFLPAVCLSQTKIEGFVYDMTTKHPLDSVKVTLFVIESVSLNTDGIFSNADRDTNQKADRVDTSYRRLKTVLSDAKGYYSFDRLDSNIYRVAATYTFDQEIIPGVNWTDYQESPAHLVKKNEQLKWSFGFQLVCKYDSTSKLTSCPSCSREDSVYNIQYGMFIGMEKDVKPKTYYNGYCTVGRCHPTKRCMRCEHESYLDINEL